MERSILHPARAHTVVDYAFARTAALAPADEGDEGWLISFVDILTLLLTLFVVLLAIAELHQHTAAPQVATVTRTQQARVAAGAARVARAAPKEVGPALVQTGVREHTSEEAPRRAGQVATKTTVAPRPGVRPLVEVPTISTTAGGPAGQPPAAVAEAKAEFSLPKDIRDEVEVIASANRVNLVITNDVLFDAGSAALRPAGRNILGRIAELLRKYHYPIAVEGHTDNTPIHTPQFPSNWELSTARATTVTRFLIEHGIDRRLLSAVGYADTRPRADNSTAQGRARNRRVSLVVHLDKPPKAASPNPSMASPAAQ